MQTYGRDSDEDDRDDDRTGFPGWQAPAVAATLFGVLSLFTRGRYADVSDAAWIGGHVMVGATIGLLVSLCDGPGPGTLLSRFLALISVATALLPIFGLPFNLAAYLMNRRHPGFHRTVSRVTLVIGVLLSCAIAGLLLAGRG